MSRYSNILESQCSAFDYVASRDAAYRIHLLDAQLYKW